MHVQFCEFYQSMVDSFNHSLGEGWLDCLQYVGIMNKTVTNIYVQVLCQHFFISLG